MPKFSLPHYAEEIAQDLCYLGNRCFALGKLQGFFASGAQSFA
jgi:hypothetical protein